MPETTELTNHKTENISEIFSYCERAACFVAKSAYEVAQGHICFGMGCADRKGMQLSNPLFPPELKEGSRGLLILMRWKMQAIYVF